MSDLPIKTWVERNGRLLRIRLMRPKANIVDIAVIEALTYIDTYLANLSTNSLRCAVKSVRHAMLQRIIPELDAVEAIYLDEMINHPDPEEGLRAFIEKRNPVWQPV